MDLEKPGFQEEGIAQGASPNSSNMAACTDKRVYLSQFLLSQFPSATIDMLTGVSNVQI